MTKSPYRLAVVFTLALVYLAGACGRADRAVGSSAATTPSASSVRLDEHGGLVEAVAVDGGQFLLDPAPPGVAPDVSAADAQSAVAGSAGTGTSPIVGYALATTPTSGTPLAGSTVKPGVDHQLVWFIWYSGVDLSLIPTEPCCDRSTDPKVGDSLFLVDAQTGHELTWSAWSEPS